MRFSSRLKIPRLSVGWRRVGGYFVNNLVRGLEVGGQLDRSAVPEQAVWGRYHMAGTLGNLKFYDCRSGDL